MNRIIACLAIATLAAPAFADDARIHTTRDSGSYEASLRMAGVPLSGGLAWSASRQGAPLEASTQVARQGAPKETPVRQAGGVTCPPGCRS